MKYSTGATYGKGEQVFENYGQPNHIYFTYHGFSMFDESAYNNCVQNTSCLTSLPVQNVHDCVHTEFELDSNMINTIDWKKANPLANVIFRMLDSKL